MPGNVLPAGWLILGRTRSRRKDNLMGKLFRATHSMDTIHEYWKLSSVLFPLACSKGLGSRKVEQIIAITIIVGLHFGGRVESDAAAQWGK